jgi:peroxiredoxin
VEAEKYEYNKADYLLLGEVFRLYDEYYRIEDISHNGGELTLIKEHNFENRTGTQVGMKAPEFNCISVDGDTINSITLHDKGIIIVNMCGCGGDTESIEEYNKIKSRYGETFHIFGLDSQFDNETGGVLINTENPYNKEVYEIYRKNYCSRMTYVIGKNRKIRNKFSTKNWQGGIEQSENSP